MVVVVPVEIVYRPSKNDEINEVDFQKMRRTLNPSRQNLQFFNLTTETVEVKLVSGSLMLKLKEHFF